MQLRLWIVLLPLLLVIAAVASHGAAAYFGDTAENGGNVFAASWVRLLDDGFEGEPWDANWDDNGTTDWGRTDTNQHSGLYCARTDWWDDGYLTSDNLDTSAATSITVSFWFRPYDVESGDMLVKLYDASTYNTWYDLADYPTFENETWCFFREEITDSQYFISNFRIRFDSSGLGGLFEDYRVDDVLIIMKQ